MRLVQVMIPAGKREAVLDTLDEEGIDYVLTDETSGRKYTGVVYFPLPTQAVEEILDALREAGLSEDAYTVVLDAETVVSRRFEELKERYEEEAEDQRIAREEIIARARDLAPRFPTFLVMTIISAVVATAGVLLDSPAVVVGSMVIAPLIGPAMATSVGSVLDDRELFVRGVKLQGIGFGVAVASAAVFAFLVKSLFLVPPGIDVLAIDQVRGRLSPDFLSLAVALGAGVAGALSLASGVSSVLVGVMIAAALVPPTAVVGIGLAWGMPAAVVGSTVLVLVNFLSINLAALATFWYKGYRPEEWFRLSEARTATLKRIAVLAAVLAVLSVFLGYVTYVSYQHAVFENTAKQEVERALATSPYEELELLAIEVEYTRETPFAKPQRVVVTVGRPVENGYPQLAETLLHRVEAETTYDVTVQVRFVELETVAAHSRSSKGSSGSYPTASMAASRTVSTFSSSSRLM
ncbi:TIGR00341 family protein [Halospeciosus flavus]|uniref:TIGR00341 family protein n=1 Tax=Halospeciosus flavus TaxID=3032283 RepID=A0ABD5Z6P8_9EURY|nr:TIGR00341 family protein [Halospeciosus flavus]